MPNNFCTMYVIDKFHGVLFLLWNRDDILSIFTSKIRRTNLEQRGELRFVICLFTYSVKSKAIKSFLFMTSGFIFVFEIYHAEHVKKS